MVAAFHGHQTTLNVLRRNFSVSSRGATLEHLVDIANQLGLSARPFRCETNELQQLRLPSILHWNLNHFVVLEKVTRLGAVILDPAIGKRYVSWKELGNRFSGIALELTPTKDFEKNQRVDRLKIVDLLPLSSPLWFAGAKAIVLSIFLQFFVLLSPFFGQLVIDAAIPRSDRTLLFFLAAAFGLFKLLEIATETIRSFVLQYISVLMSFDMETSVLRHLIRLPLDYFQKRHIGDIQQRFQTIQQIKNFVIQGLVGAFIDGVFALTIGVVLFLYDPYLALIALSTVGAYAAIRLGFLHAQKQLTMNVMVTEAEKNSNFLETLRAMPTIKGANLENKRENSWRNHAVTALNAQVKIGNASILFKAAGALLLGASNIFVMYYAAQEVMNFNITVGMLVAFLAFKSQFESRLFALMETFLNLKVLDAQVERIADIVESEREPIHSDSGPIRKIDGAISAKDITFRYSPFEPAVLKGVSIEITQGEFVAFTGPSGGGKTTLVKLLIGLLEPTSGEIFIDDVPMSQIGQAQLRQQMSIVAQNEGLISGTVTDNITLFDEHVDQDKLNYASQMASIFEDITRMPMQFNSLVGDMGTSLSGGQVQRLLLARAIYRSPSILVLDEATSQLDVPTEKLINESLRRLNITRLVVAHRPDTVEAADRVYFVAGGTITAVSPNEL